jgi:heme A synthase
METRPQKGQKPFALFAWIVLVFNIPVILWGAYVRVSYSGDGCGAHWPFCNGQALPQNMSKPTIIEFTHRMMTSVDTFLVLAMLLAAFWLYPTRHIIRKYALASFGFLLVEALLGAGLVLFRMVARDQSAGRIWYLSAHLINTMLLLATLTITAWLASQGFSQFQLRNIPPRLRWSALVTVFISITGAVAALGDMLFPTESLMEGMRRDFSAASPMLLRLRMTHPAIAIAGAGFVIWVALTVWRSSDSDRLKKASLRLVALIVFQLFWGAANLTLLAPVWMQLSHLLIADFVWIAVVLVAAEASAVEFSPSVHRSESGLSLKLSRT